MAEMEASVHVGVGKVAEPLGELLLDLVLGEASDLLGGRSIDLEDVLFLPSILILDFKRFEEVALSRLENGEQEPAKTGEDGPGPTLWSGPWGTRDDDGRERKSKDSKVALLGTKDPLS